MTLMINSKLLTIITLCVTAISCGQDNNCKDFKEGTFYLPPVDQIGEYYIYRKGNRQIEINENKKETYYYLKWHNSCSYTVTLAEIPIDTSSNIYNSKRPDSIRIEYIKTIKDTVYYNSKAYIDNKAYELLGLKMIKIGEVPPSSR